MKNFRIMKTVKKAATVALAVTILVFNAMTALAASNITIKEDSVRVRQSASTDSTQLGSVKKGSSFDVKETVSDSSGAAWYKIAYDGTNLGYIRADMAVDSTSAEATTLKNAATATATPAATATPTPTPTAEPTQAAPTVDTSINVAVSTAVTDVTPVSATVNNNTVNVRGEANASSGRVTTVNKNTAVTIVGQADGTDGKVWYLTNFTYDSKDVKGFIRSDFLSVSGEVVPVTEAAPEEVEEPVEEEPVEPEPVVPQDYELKYETGDDGNYQWYLYDNTSADGTVRRSKLDSILEAANAYALQENSSSLGSKAKIIIIVMAIVLVIMALAITLLIFRIRDLEYDDDEDYDTYGKEPQRDPRTVRPAGQRPAGARPAGHAEGARPAGARPAGARPAGQRPEGARPAGQRPEGARPAGQRPEGARPAGHAAGTRPEGARPTGHAAGTRPEGARPAGQRPTGHAEGARPAGHAAGARPEGARPEGAPKSQAPADDANLKPKNLASESDDFEFEFLNKWDEDDN